jgi:hypothetical protein
MVMSYRNSSFRLYACLSLLILMVAASAMLLLGCGDNPTEAEGGWSRVADSKSIFSSEGNDVVITDVCAGGPGFVAVGFRHEVEIPMPYRDKEDVGNTGTLEIWVSENGREWSRLGASSFSDSSSPELGEYAVRLQEVMGRQASAHIEVQQFTPPRICSSPSGLAISCCLNLWTSKDGREWTQLPPDDAAFAPEPGAPHLYPVGIVDVTPAADGPGFVAIGYLWNEQRGTTQACMWDSPGREGWTRAPADLLAFLAFPQIYTITNGGPGLVMAGSGISLQAMSFEERQLYYLNAQVWTSGPDGLSWSEVPYDAAVFGGAENQEIVDIAQAGPGLVAVGHDGGFMSEDSPPVKGAVWVSSDGISWQRTGRDEASFTDTTIYESAASETGLVAVGKAIITIDPESRDSYFTACVWTSEDGSSWKRIDLPRASEGIDFDSCLYGIASSEGTMVAVGYDNLENGLLSGAIWFNVGE